MLIKSILVLLVVFWGNPFQKIQGQGCSISSFTMTPQGQVSLGTWVFLEGHSDCGTVRFHITNGVGQAWDKAEIGNGSQTETMKTEEFGTGTYDVCFQARGDGGWENAAKSCLELYVQGSQGQPPGSENNGDVLCWVNGFTATPGTAQIGTTIQLAGYGQCDGNARASRFYIDSVPWGENGSNTNSASWNTTNIGEGDHSVCFGVTSDEWSEEARSCTTITLTSAPQPPAPPSIGPPTDNGQDGQTPDSGAGNSNHSDDSQSGSNSNNGNGNNNNHSTGSSDGSYLSQARQTGSDGGFDLIFVAYSWGYANVVNDNGRWDGWKMYGNGRNDRYLTMDDFNTICYQVYGNGYYAVKVSDDLSGIKCHQGSGNNQSGSNDQNNSSESNSTNSNCPTSPPIVNVGWTAQVSDADPSSLPIRSVIGMNAPTIGSIPVRTTIGIIAGPECADGWRWWLVDYNGQVGWIGEVGPQNLYNLMNPSQGESSNSGSNSNSNPDLLDQLDLEEPCVAVSSATLAGTNPFDVVDCVESLLSDMTEQDAMNVVAISWDCGVSQVSQIIIFATNLKVYGLALSARAAFTPDEVADCVIDFGELLGW